MNTRLIDKTELNGSPTQALGAFLVPLIGLPFLFARLGYADELTLHLGISREAAHQRLRKSGIRHGSYMISVRGSAWIMNSETKAIVEQIDKTIFKDMQSLGKPITKQEIASANIITPNAVVVGMASFPVEDTGGLGLRLDFSDHSMVIIIPTADEPEVDLADWALRTPTGRLSVGPGIKVVWEAMAEA